MLLKEPPLFVENKSFWEVVETDFNRKLLWQHLMAVQSGKELKVGDKEKEIIASLLEELRENGMFNLRATPDGKILYGLATAPKPMPRINVKKEKDSTPLSIEKVVARVARLKTLIEKFRQPTSRWDRNGSNSALN